jgi:hypothetical protein
LFAQRNEVGLNKINKPKPCFICGRTNHLAKQCYFNPANQRVNLRNQKRFMAENRSVNQKFKTPVKTNIYLKNRSSKTTKGFTQKWVLKATNNVSAASCVSTANQKDAANSVNAVNKVSTVHKVSAANTNNAANKVNTANKVSAANLNSSTNKVSTAPEDSAAKPEKATIISTKFSSHEIPQSADSQNSRFKEFTYVDANGQPKTTSAWVPQSN